MRSSSGEEEGVLPDAQAGQLASTIEVQPFDWRRLAKYSFWVALICIVTAVSSVLADRVLAQLLERLSSDCLTRRTPSSVWGWRLLQRGCIGGA